MAVGPVLAGCNCCSLVSRPEQQFHAVGNVDERERWRMRAGDDMQIEILDRPEDGEHRFVPRTKNDPGTDDRGGDLVGEGQGLLLTRQFAPAVVADRLGRIRFHPDLSAGPDRLRQSRRRG